VCIILVPTYRGGRRAYNFLVIIPLRTEINRPQLYVHCTRTHAHIHTLTYTALVACTTLVGTTVFYGVNIIIGCIQQREESSPRSFCLHNNNNIVFCRGVVITSLCIINNINIVNIHRRGTRKVVQSAKSLCIVVRRRRQRQLQ